jgi:PIN like domain
MDKHFGYFRQPPPRELDALLSSSLIAFDANVLLNLYRYSPDTRREFLDILAKSQSQLWLPHQAGMEFHQNRLSVMRTHAAQFAAVRATVEGLRGQILALYRSPKSAPPAKKSAAEAAIDSLLAYLDSSATDCIAPTNDISKDSVWREVVALFGDNVGDPYDQAQTSELYKEASERFDAKRPPGYEDGSKPVPNRYGDFILWRQVTDKALKAQHPVVLVTDDRKADWWAVLDGKTLGPLPELREEMRRLANQPFHMYNPGLFMVRMAARLNLTASRPALAEVRSLPPISADLRPRVSQGISVSVDYARAREQRHLAVVRRAESREALEHINARVERAGSKVSKELRRVMASALLDLREAEAAASAALVALRAADERQHALGPTGVAASFEAGYAAGSNTVFRSGPSSTPASQREFYLPNRFRTYFGPTGPTGPGNVNIPFVTDPARLPPDFAISELDDDGADVLDEDPL